MTPFGLKLGRPRAKGEKPILAVDIDGVISLFGFEQPPLGEGAKMELINGTMHCVLIPAGGRLRRLADYYDVVWVSGLERGAEQLSKLLGLPRWPYLTFKGAARFGSADWKLEPLGHYARGRPLAWIDDSFNDACYDWARDREEPTLLLATESDKGLLEIQVEALLGWARSLSAEAAATPPR